MKKSIVILLISLAGMGICRGQQYGWTNITANLPDFYNDTVIINDGADTIIAAISDLTFLDDNHGWICTSHPFTTQPSAVLKTTDGGQSWTEYLAPQAGTAIYMIDSDTGYFGGNNGMIYKTVDGAASWTYFGTLTGTLYAFGFPPRPAKSGWAGGYNGKLVKITPQGIIPVSLGLAGNVYCIDFPSVERGYALLDYQMIIYFKDEAWHVEASYPFSSKSYLHFVNDTLGWCVGAMFLKTEVGTDWYRTDPTFVQTGSMMGVYFTDENNGWAVGTLGEIAYTNDGGNDWTMLTHNLTQEYLGKVMFTSPHNGYIIGGNKTLLKYTQISNIAETKIACEINIYPNPATHTINIEYPTSENLNVTLINLMGEQVMQRHFAGTKASVDISSLPLGMYIIKVSGSDGQVQKKLIKE